MPFSDQAAAVRCDVTSVADLEATRDLASELFGRTDIVLNNVGILAVGAAEEIPFEAWERSSTSTSGWPSNNQRYSICYMEDEAELMSSLARVAAETDQLRARASASLREAVGKAADRGLTQKQIARAIGRSQPEVSRLVHAYRTARFRPRSPLGRQLVRHRDEIVALAHAHKASNVRVFGSVVHGKDDEASDIDLLVDLEPGADLLDLAALDRELERLLGRPVDVVPARMLKPHVARSALADAVEL